MSKVRLAALTLSLVLVGGCIPSCKTVYQDKDVKVVLHDLVVLLNVHASSQKVELTAAGKTFKNIYGFNQAFLRTSDTNVIVFVTGGNYVGYDSQPLDLHVLNLRTKADVTVRLGSFVDYDLLIDATKGDVKVESYNGRRLVLFSTREKIVRKLTNSIPIGRLEIDLDKKQIIPSTGGI